MRHVLHWLELRERYPLPASSRIVAYLNNRLPLKCITLVKNFRYISIKRVSAPRRAVHCRYSRSYLAHLFRVVLLVEFGQARPWVIRKPDLDPPLARGHIVHHEDYTRQHHRAKHHKHQDQRKELDMNDVDTESAVKGRRKKGNEKCQ